MLILEGLFEEVNAVADELSRRIDLVGDARGKLSDGLKLLGLRKLLLEGLALGDVQHGEKNVFFSVHDDRRRAQRVTQRPLPAFHQHAVGGFDVLHLVVRFENGVDRIPERTGRTGVPITTPSGLIQGFHAVHDVSRLLAEKRDAVRDEGLIHHLVGLDDVAAPVDQQQPDLSSVENGLQVDPFGLQDVGLLLERLLGQMAFDGPGQHGGDSVDELPLLGDEGAFVHLGPLLHVADVHRTTQTSLMMMGADSRQAVVSKGSDS